MAIVGRIESIHRHSGYGAGRGCHTDGQHTRPERPSGVTHLAEFGSDDFAAGSTIGPDQRAT
jgi:hypothetical protein